MRYLFPIALALSGVASAQNFTIPTNAAANNGLSTTGSGNLLNFTAGACDSVITHMTTASSAAANAAYSFEIWTRDGSGLGGPVGAGPGSSPAGWTSLGVVNATQGPVASGISVLLDIPDIKVRAGTTVGVAFVFTGAGPRYFGTGTPPLQLFNDSNLTVTTGDARSAVFTTGGTWFSSRGHVGEFRGYHGCDLTVTDCLPGAFVDISGSGAALNLADDASVAIPTTVGNAIFAAGTAQVGSNGAVRFNGAGTGLGFTNGALPNASVFGGDQALCAFWDDVNTVGGTVGNIYWQEIGGTLYVQWNNVGFFSDAVNRATFQIQVHSSGPAYAQFVYTDIENVRAAGGGSATIGYQAGATGTNNHQYTLDAPNAVRNGSVLSLTRTTTRVLTPHLPGAWIEISGTGAALNLSDDGEVDIPTTVGNALFPQGLARVGSNGGVRFAGTGTELGFTNLQIPSVSAFNGDQTLLPFWDDVNTVSGTVGNIYWQEVGDTLVVQWDDIGFFGAAGTERATFQLQVHGSGAIPAQFLYQDVEGARAASGGSATVGYQGGTVGSDARWSLDTASLENGMVLSLLEAGRKPGANYCNANPNSTGQTGELILSGTSSVAANNLRLNAYRLPNAAFGYFIASRFTGFVPNAGGGMGNICLGAPIGRAVGGGILNTGGSGSFGILANLAAIPQPAGGPVAGMPGETWNFQAWHRDSVGGVATSNLTNASQIQLTP
jgi:hypothetical protein